MEALKVGVRLAAAETDGRWVGCRDGFVRE